MSPPNKGEAFSQKSYKTFLKKEKMLEEESQIAESKSLPEPSSTSAILDPKPSEKEETPISDFMLEFEDEFFYEYGNTSNYHVMGKP
jgi:hypothetical protein